MSERSKPHPAVKTKETVVTYLACDENVRTPLAGSVDKEVAGTATKRHTCNGLLRTFAVLDAAGAEDFLQTTEHRGGFCGDYVADDATSAAAVGRWEEKLHIGQTEMTGHFVANAAIGIVEVGMGGIDGNIRKDGTPHTALHIPIIGDAFQPTEEQRMVAYDEITAVLYGRNYGIFRDIKTQ